MRIGLIIYGSLDIVSGGYLYDRMLVEYLRHKGDQVEILSLPWRNYCRHLCDNLSLSLRRRLEQADWDILLEDELNHPSLFQLNKNLKGKITHPIISIVHHLRSCELRADWKNRFYRFVERNYLNSVDGFIFNSQTTRSEVEGLIGRDKPSIVAHPGRDRFRRSLTVAQIAERALQSGPLRVLFLGNVIPRKGLHILLKALALLPKESWRLEVVGNLEVDLSYSKAIRRQMAKLGLEHQVELKGLLPDVEVADCMIQNQVLAVPSSYESFGISYLEALGFGLSVIASTVGGAKKLITQKREGFLISPGDTDRLAQKIQKLHNDRKLLSQMSLRAFERHRHFPTWELSANRIRDFLERQSLSMSNSRKPAI